MVHATARPDLAVIIVSYNDGRWLEACIRSVYARAGSATLDVIVVDNESTDGTRAIIERALPDVRVISSPNGGFGYGNNRGWEATRARYALFLNPDTEVIAGEFGALIASLDARPTIGLAGVRHLTGDGSPYPSMRRFPSAARALGEALGSEHWVYRPSWSGERVLDMKLYEREQHCDWTVGAFMLARREALLSAGVMDERYFLLSEEPDLCLRMRQAGWEVRHLPEMTIVHHAGKSGRDPRMTAQDAFSRRQYADKHFCRAHRALYLTAIAIRHLVRAIAPGGSGDGSARRAAARRALRVLIGSRKPPFCEPPATALMRVGVAEASTLESVSVGTPLFGQGRNANEFVEVEPAQWK
jgi:hypothetical protein